MRKYYEFIIDYFQDEDGVFTAVVPALQGCVASGNSMEQAYNNAVEAIESCLEVRRKLDMPVAKNSYLGKNVYRVPIAV